jgi:hypothetical protein
MVYCGMTFEIATRDNGGRFERPEAVVEALYFIRNGLPKMADVRPTVAPRETPAERRLRVILECIKVHGGM